MIFPTTLQYIETILNPEGLFSSLGEVRMVGDDFCSGNFGTVFKIQTSQGVRALKCFTRAQYGRLSAYRRIAQEIKGSQYTIDYHYLEDEIYVFGDSVEGHYFPVVVMDWVDGETLTRKIERAVTASDVKSMESLAAKFDAMSDWLLQQSFAHNDLKPDNIMVKSSDSGFVLIDYDGMFIESMAGEAAREFGTEPFQSHSRATARFDRHVDNYSIAYIRRAFKELISNPKRYHPSSMVDFTPDELADIEVNHTIFGSRFQYLGSSVFGIMIYKKDELYGFIERNGVPLTDTLYDAVGDFGENGLAAVRSHGKWGYINRTGQVVIPLIYEECSTFAEERAAVKVGAKWGYIDTEGNAVSRFVYDNGWSFRYGVALVRRGSKYGFLSHEGRVAISLKFDHAQSFTAEGVACVMLGQRYGYINTKGEWWERPTYDYAQSFRDGRAAVELNEREFFITYKL